MGFVTDNRAMTYRTTVLPNGRIDMSSLPLLPPGTVVWIKVLDPDELDAGLLAQGQTSGSSLHGHEEPHPTGHE